MRRKVKEITEAITAKAIAIEIEELNAVITKPTKAPNTEEMAIFFHFGESARDGMFLEVKLCGGVRARNVLEAELGESGISEICFLFATAEYLVVLLNGIPIVEPLSIPSSHPNLIANLDANPGVRPCAQTALDVASNLGPGYIFASRDPK